MEIDIRILKSYGIDFQSFDIESPANGLINQTHILKSKIGGSDYVLQSINTHVFQRPEWIFQNLALAGDDLAAHFPDYPFIRPMRTEDGQNFVKIDQMYWRLMPYVPNSLSLSQADTPEQAFEAAFQFGKLAKVLSACPQAGFQQTIPNFHNLSLRMEQLKAAIAQASPGRLEHAKECIQSVTKHQEIYKESQKLIACQALPDRLMHHDTKISNALLDKHTHKGLCVIDLDTLMPGKIYSDFGDMMRTYLCPLTEEATIWPDIEVRDLYFEAIHTAYMDTMGSVLNQTERQILVWSGSYMIYMQAVRFLADYLAGDVYYPVNHDQHNLDRAKNQLILLERVRERGWK